MVGHSTSNWYRREAETPPRTAPWTEKPWRLPTKLTSKCSPWRVLQFPELQRLTRRIRNGAWEGREKGLLGIQKWKLEIWFLKGKRKRSRNCRRRVRKLVEMDKKVGFWRHPHATCRMVKKIEFARADFTNRPDGFKTSNLVWLAKSQASDLRFRQTLGPY